MVIAAFRGDFVYDALLWLHILCAIVGFGGVLLNALYGAQAKQRPGPGGLAISEANFFVSGIAQYFIYGVFVFGFLVIAVSEDPAELGEQTWVWLSIVLYVVALGISHGVVKPTAKKMIALQQEMVSAGPPPADAPPGPPPQVAQMEVLGKKMGTFGPVLSILFLVILYLMVFKPGV
jgi:uncharacterized membrane protein